MITATPQSTLSPLDTSNFFFKKLFFESKDLLLIFDFISDKCVDVNNSVLSMTGYSKEEFLSLGRKELTPKFSKYNPGVDLHDTIINTHTEKVLRGESINEIGIISKRDGSEIIVDLEIIPTERRAGEAFIKVKDIHSQFLDRKKYRESEKEFKSIVESTDAGISRVDLKGRHIYVSPQIEKMSGYSAEEMLGNPTEKFFRPHEAEKFKSYTKKLLKGEPVEKSNIFEAVHKDGHSIWVQGTAALIKDKEGKPASIQTVFINITDRVLLQKKLEKTENGYQHIVENLKGVVITTSLMGKTMFASPQIEDILGYKPSEIEGDYGVNLFFPEEKENLEKEAIQLATQKYDRIQNVYKGKHKDGSPRWINGTASLTKNKDGKPTGFLTVFTDITQEVQLQNQLKSTRDKYQSLFDNAIDPIIVRDLSTNKVIDCNASAITFLGISGTDEFSQIDKIVESVTNDAGQSFKEIFDQQKTKIARGEKSNFRINYANSSGDKYIVEINLVIDDTDLQKPKGIFFLKDVTDQVNAYEKIDQERKLLTAVIEGTTDQIIVQDIDRKVIAVNSNFAKAYYRANKVHVKIGTDMTLLDDYSNKVGFGDNQERNDAIESVLKGNTVKHQYTFDQSGTKYHFSLSASPLKNKLEEVVGIICVIRNISKLVAKNEEIAKQNIELQKYIDSNIQLENFAYIASHDLKQPLRTIMSFSELLKNKKADILDKDSNIYLDFILESSERLNNLISDMLAYSIIGTGTEKEILDPSILINNVLHDLRAQIEQSQAIVKLKSIPKSLNVYKTEFISLIQNLVSNSIKYSKEGVTPIINISAIDDNNNWKFKLEDNGIGIEERYLEKIFGMFQRLKVEQSTTGTGIGLAHCKKILELHKGKIWAESKINLGTTFYFTIPK